MLTIHGDSGIPTPTNDNAPLLEIEHGEEDIPRSGFALNTFKLVFSVRVDNDFVISSVALDMMKRMSYLPSLGLGKNQQGSPTFNIVGIPRRKHGLGYICSSGVLKKEKKALEKAAKQVFCGQEELIWDLKSRTYLPSFEISPMTLGLMMKKKHL